MVYGLNAVLAFSSSARRDAVQDAVVTRIDSRPRWSVDVIVADANRIGPNGLTVALRFVSRADADDLQARIESFAAGPRAPLPGSHLTVHTCTHDEEAPAPCVVVAERTW